MTGVVVIGGGQAGLATGFYLQRSGLVPDKDFVILDAAAEPGGAWARMWPTLRTFSPTQYSSLPGWMMPPWTGDSGYPLAAHVVDYLTRYEQRYGLAVRRSVAVRSVIRGHRGLLEVHTGRGDWLAEHVVSATGTWTRPFVPAYPGSFAGRQLHTADYRHASDFAGQRVLIVGGGNSAAQILAEVSQVAGTIWVTLRPPRFLPDDVDGRVLFELATRRYRARRLGGPDTGGVAGLGDIVMVDSVRAARDRNVLRARGPFARLVEHGVRWRDGSESSVDTIIWCTGFRPALGHLTSLGLRGPDGRMRTDGTQAIQEPRLHLIGYGDWTGPASATLIGAGRTARDLVTKL
ncbi:NAD(P)/FAD-dependent oxidoreductase [Kribbella turkmenica]|uniref:NAD(P)/FAD-dependent oxidoreductase n=1 Tax=Kribbella turkmenica TaxID=2530375 RepID=A0A4R4WIW7_9ACTN|nr:ArsO family NAD(P)H-dependent flavin-containing monooxygenase [Kribbella turkmenica]TDD19138.1 NAD(P)/FAD-dependent oxidoreductase [Kribbella turkmenica]